jgi:hypothetical protein
MTMAAAAPGWSPSRRISEHKRGSRLPATFETKE